MYFTASNNYQTYLKNIEQDIDFEVVQIFVTVEEGTKFNNVNNNRI